MEHLSYQKIRDLLLIDGIDISQDFYENWKEDNDISNFISWYEEEIRREILEKLISDLEDELDISTNQ